MLYPKPPFVLGRTKLALLVIFALLGACQASWVTVTPDVKNALELTTADSVSSSWDCPVVPCADCWQQAVSLPRAELAGRSV